MRFGYQEQFRGLDDSSKELSLEQRSPLSFTVLFTTLSGTINALRKATCLAHQLGAEVRILVLQIVPFPSPVDEPRMDAQSRYRQLRSFCEQERIEARIDVRWCRDPCSCIHDAFLPQSLVLIGGQQSWWHLTAKKRLADKLKQAGHHVVFV